MTKDEFTKVKKGLTTGVIIQANKYIGEIYKYEDIKQWGASLLYGYLYALGLQDGIRKERERKKAIEKRKGEQQKEKSTPKAFDGKPKEETR